MINAKSKGTEGKLKVSMSVPIIGIKMSAVGVFATKPEIRLININKINDSNIGLNNSNGIPKNISLNPAWRRQPIIIYSDMKKKIISHSISLNNSPIDFFVCPLFTRTKINAEIIAVKYNKGKIAKRTIVIIIAMLLK